MKYTLHLNRGLPPPNFNLQSVELEDEKILCNNVVFPWEFNPHNVRLWVIGHEFGPITALWADCEQDAFDEFLDQNNEEFLVSEEDQAKATDYERAEWSYLGNAGEPCDLSMAWIGSVEFDKARDFDLLMAFAEQRGACADNLWK